MYTLSPPRFPVKIFFKQNVTTLLKKRGSLGLVRVIVLWRRISSDFRNEVEKNAWKGIKLYVGRKR